MTEAEFIQEVLAKIAEGGPRTAMAAADEHSATAVGGMLTVLENGSAISEDIYDKVDETTHSLLSVIVTLLMEQSELLRALIERTPPLVAVEAPEAPKPNEKLSEAMDKLFQRIAQPPAGGFKP